MINNNNNMKIKLRLLLQASLTQIGGGISFKWGGGARAPPCSYAYGGRGSSHSISGLTQLNSKTLKFNYWYCYHLCHRLLYYKWENVCFYEKYELHLKFLILQNFTTLVSVVMCKNQVAS